MSKMPLTVAFRTDKNNSTDLLTQPEKSQKPQKKVQNRSKPLTRKDVLAEEVSSSSVELDYNDAAAKLENIFKLNSTPKRYDDQDITVGKRRGQKRKKKTTEVDKKEDGVDQIVVRSPRKKPNRLSLDRRILLKRNKNNEVVASVQKEKNAKSNDKKIERLVRDYSASTDLVSLDWKKMKIPHVLPSTEHVWLFKLMQPMQALLEVNQNLRAGLGKEPTEGELADAMKMTVTEVRKHLEAGRAARNKLIKHNLRLVLFVINKHFQDFANGPKFQDLCQAGVKGLITAIDRFEPNRKLRLSTYSLFWVRHAIIRSMTLSSFTRVSFGLESVRVEIRRAKLQLLFDLNRLPTEDEIIEKVGISPERYREVMRASKPVLSLNSKHAVTQEEFISRITDVDGVEGDDRRKSALLRLALDDVLDSLKPKESLVVRQRYGLDGKGDRTLGEIAGNLNISREMVRKYEVKALMKLKHPARVGHLRQYMV
ncbi:hypothetical protein SAY86_020639 [Trapa natans]|uniref:RNA polymerase sigma factor sigE, chloroplastic/mitochondrial n=1 Tax=Trapa natans TaxID=22666 RepID=A0AAN7R5R2_TRANT|nr:hypothetical protein SAY86_020639 [Trapa natans]